MIRVDVEVFVACGRGSFGVSPGPSEYFSPEQAFLDQSITRYLATRKQISTGASAFDICCFVQLSEHFVHVVYGLNAPL